MSITVKLKPLAPSEAGGGYWIHTFIWIFRYDGREWLRPFAWHVPSEQFPADLKDEFKQRRYDEFRRLEQDAYLSSNVRLDWKTYLDALEQFDRVYPIAA